MSEAMRMQIATLILPAHGTDINSGLAACAAALDWVTGAVVAVDAATYGAPVVPPVVAPEAP